MGDALTVKRKSQAAWIPEMDFLRAFAILFVLAIHVIYLLSYRESAKFDALLIVNLCLDVFSSVIAVPLFIFISGFVLCRAYYDNFNISGFYKKRFKSIIPPYLIFSVLYIVFDNYLFGPVTFKDAFLRILTASGYPHLWFFAMIIQLYILYPLIIKLYRFFEKRSKVLLLIAASLLIDIIWTSLMMSYQSRLSIGGFNVHVFFEMWLYFILGIHLGRNFEKCRSFMERVRWYLLVPVSATLMLTICLLFLIPMKNGYNPLAQPYIPRPYWYSAFTLAPFLWISILPLLYKAALRIHDMQLASRIFGSIGKYSFGIYLVHVFYLVIFSLLLVRVGLGYGSWAFYPIMCLLTVGSSYATVWAISRLPYSEFLIGFGPSRACKSREANENITR